MHVSSFDWEQGGLKTPIKFLDRDSIEYSLTQAALHNKNEERMARLSLINGMGLLDPDQGGIYQFATQNCRHQCHYSKSMAAQAGSLRLYSLAYALLREHDFLATARNICDYLHDVLLTPAGVFQSVPTDTVVHMDKYKFSMNDNNSRIHIHENAWAIEALATFYEFSGEPGALEMATGAADRLLSEPVPDNSGVKYAQAELRLRDKLAIARAFLQLYRVTGERRYLQLADDTAGFICSQFINARGGFNTCTGNTDDNKHAPQIDENICTSRFLNLLYYYTDKINYLEMARHGLRYLAIPQVATSRMEEAGILLLDEELSGTPLKIPMTGDKNDPRVAKLHQAALRSFGWYKVLHHQGTESLADH